MRERGPILIKSREKTKRSRNFRPSPWILPRSLLPEVSFQFFILLFLFYSSKINIRFHAPADSPSINYSKIRVKRPQVPAGQQHCVNVARTAKPSRSPCGHPAHAWPTPCPLSINAATEFLWTLTSSLNREEEKNDQWKNDQWVGARRKGRDGEGGWGWAHRGDMAWLSPKSMRVSLTTKKEEGKKKVHPIPMTISKTTGFSDLPWKWHFPPLFPSFCGVVKFGMNDSVRESLPRGALEAGSSAPQHAPVSPNLGKVWSSGRQAWCTDTVYHPPSSPPLFAFPGIFTH